MWLVPLAMTGAWADVASPCGCGGGDGGDPRRPHTSEQDTDDTGTASTRNRLAAGGVAMGSAGFLVLARRRRRA